MLNSLFSSQIPLGIAQAATAIILALIILFIARRRQIHLEKEGMIALARGIIQIVVVGSILVLVFKGPSWTSIFILAVMMITAAGIGASRAKGIPGAFRISFYGITAGSGIVIALMTAFGVIDSKMSSLIPVGSMLIANAMNTNSLTLERFKSEIEGNVGLIESGLALGADPRIIVKRHVQAAVKASLIPRIDSLRSLGIVWIPGLMAGMVLSGSDPVYAAIYQFVVISMIFSSSGLTSVISTLLIRPYVFSKAEQLILRPGEE